MTHAQKDRTTREKAARLRAEAEVAQARRRGHVVGAVVAAVVLVLVAAVVVVQQARHDRAVAAAAQPSGVPRNVSSDGGIVAVFPGAAAPTAAGAVTVELWEDLQCPACRAFSGANAAALERWARHGVVRLVYKPVSFLDGASTTRYSSRALNAAAAVADSAPAAFPAFHGLLFAHQPAEGGAGLTDAQLVEYAVQAGAPREAVASALATRRYQGWIVQRTEEFSRKYSGTPTIVVDGTVLRPDDPTTVISGAALQAAVAKAAAARGLPLPT
jgi:protein-disulfide isomerase